LYLVDGSALGWRLHTWEPAIYKLEEESKNCYSGSICQKITVNSGQLIFKQNFDFLSGTTYQASFWLRSSDAITVQVVFRKAGRWYDLGAAYTTQPGSVWEKVTISGGFWKKTKGYVGLWVKGKGTLWVDQASLTDTTQYDKVNLSGTVIKHMFFGDHLNKFPIHKAWPESNPGLIRLWDSVTRWRDIEPDDDVWKWKRLDSLLEAASANGAEVIYTLGQPPKWASSKPSIKGVYGAGASSAPTNIHEWKEYIHATVERAAGRIRYWEIWNEGDHRIFNIMAPGEVAELASAAREVFDEIDPDLKLLTPNITRGGLGWLDRYLHEGGKDSADAISFHVNHVGEPENSFPYYEGVRSLAVNHGLANLPLFNTEGAVEKTQSAVSDAGRVARAYILQAILGISNWSYYGWDLHLKDRVALSDKSYTKETVAGSAYRETVDWLVGSKLISYHRNFDGEGSWYVELQREDSYRGWLLWNPNSYVNFTIPNHWNAKQLRDLKGNTRAVHGQDIVTINASPILIEGRDNTSADEVVVK
jgi:hypothetical protein